MSQIKLVVYKDHTLGYILPQTPKYVGVLHASILRGASNDGSHGPLLIHKDSDWRLATREDFKTYRVVFNGYEKDPRYLYDKSK